MKISVARNLAYQVLAKIEQGGAFTNLTLQQAFRRTKLDLRDKALATEIIYGTIQRRRSLDALLQPFSKRQLATLQGSVLTLLRMTTYQLAYLDKVPRYAAIHEGVELCKQESPFAAGFVNGVLRAYTRDPRLTSERLHDLTRQAQSWADGMGMLYSYPTWMVEELEQAYGQEAAGRMLEASNERSHLSVRVNGLKTSPEAVVNELPADLQPIVSRSELTPVGLRLARGLDVESWQPYKDGRVTVQDEAAMLIAPLLRPAQHLKILDMCAAPGTKTTHIAELQRDEGHITAVDLHRHKLDLLDQATSRLGLQSITTVATDARTLGQDEHQRECYDAVLLDVPCSGLGVLRHRPDIRWKRQPKDIASLHQLQQELLTVAAKLVKPGGVIVYSTCTLLPAENEQVVSAVVENSSAQLAWDDLRPDLPVALQNRVKDARSGLLITPEMYGTDGFYMARLKKLT